MISRRRILPTNLPDLDLCVSVAGKFVEIVPLAYGNRVERAMLRLSLDAARAFAQAVVAVVDAGPGRVWASAFDGVDMQILIVIGDNRAASVCIYTKASFPAPLLSVPLCEGRWLARTVNELAGAASVWQQNQCWFPQHDQGRFEIDV